MSIYDNITEAIVHVMIKIFKNIIENFILKIILLFKRLTNKSIKSTNIIAKAKPQIKHKKWRDFETKLNILRHLSEYPIVLLGASYLDIMLHPIHTDRLTPDEWSNINPIRVDLGGASLWTGRYLWKLYRQKSHVFSIKGQANTPFSNYFDFLLKQEPWIKDHFTVGPPGSHTPVTVHLLQRDFKFTTMFTHRGALAWYSWNEINFEQLIDILSEGGVLLLTGFLKTSLHIGLYEHLGRIASKAIICVDHGHIIPDIVDGAAIQALRDVFRDGLVDIYLTSLADALCLVNYDNVTINTNFYNLQDSIDIISSSRYLPLITFVRYVERQENIKSFCIYNGQVIPLHGERGRLLTPESVGSRNIYNAAILYHLKHGPSITNALDLVYELGTYALGKWYKVSIKQ